MFCWLIRVLSSKECVCCVCDPSVCLGVPSICLISVFYNRGTGSVDYVTKCIYSQHPYCCVNNIVLALFLKQSKFDVLICSLNLFQSHGAA